MFPARGWCPPKPQWPAGFFAFVPHTNRLDLTTRAVAALAPWKQVLVVVDNTGDAGVLRDQALVVRMPHRMTFVQIQNWALGRAVALGAPWYAFCHNDACPAVNTPKRLVDLARLWQQPWGAIFTNYDSLTIYRTAALQAVGGWDENLRQYLADTDMYRRLRLAGFPLLESRLQVEHAPSQTIKADPHLKWQHETLNGHLVDYYVRKWGGPPGRERFTKPWDGDGYPA